ncbi:MAG: nitroreductase family protein [candidate division Zixibacteria bacterium]|nr:nitroreductase family protein [candidate division Zixibacteria bacterium]
MDALDAILSRRSIRQYTAEPVPEEAVRTLLEAAMSAPSAGDERPWQFVVITDRRKLDEIPRIHPYAKMVQEAPVAILVCGDERLEKHKGFWVQDCSAAVQNVLIAARALGLGAVWCGVYPREARVAGFRELLGLPPEVIPLALVPVGWPAEEKPPGERFDERRVRYDRWERTG